MRYASQLTKRLIQTLNVFLIIGGPYNSNVYAKCSDKPVRVAVIDTGFGYKGRGKGVRLCKTGHKDFSSDQLYVKYPDVIDPVPMDIESHGTNVAGIIEKYAREAHTNYCLVILKFHSLSNSLVNMFTDLKGTIFSFRRALELKTDIVNYSAGGPDPSTEEREIIEQYLNGGGILVVAAGNNSTDLDTPKGNYYPAKYDRRIIVVGMLNRDGKKSSISNWGKVVNRWEVGYHILGYGISMSGTSQSTAVATGKIVSKSKNKCYTGGK
jgi:serine protease